MTLDLKRSATIGVRLAGRLAGIRDGGRALRRAGDPMRLADLMMGGCSTVSTLSRAPGHRRRGRAPHRFAPTRVAERPPLERTSRGRDQRPSSGRPAPSPIRLARGAGARSQGPGRPRGGVDASPGLYPLGLPFLRRRKSAFIDGAADDAHDLANTSPRTGAATGAPSPSGPRPARRERWGRSLALAADPARIDGSKNRGDGAYAVKAMVLDRPGTPLRLADLPMPEPGAGADPGRGSAPAASAGPICTWSTAS